LRRVYGDTDHEFVLDIPDWEILDEGCTVLLGPSGSGKTSLLRVLTGFDREASYSWKFDNVDLAQLPPGERRLGMVTQGADLFPHLTAKANLQFAAEARGIPSTEADRQIEEFTQSLSLEKCLSRKTAVLSGGERQRVALARALMSQPRLLFLDEPFSALDIPLRKEVRRMVQDILKNSKIPSVLITHDPEDLAGLQGKISEMSGGKIVSERKLTT
jgi:ABC-type Fe3+/spermidine/putrescine transport system ATPase subunit